MKPASDLEGARFGRLTVRFRLKNVKGNTNWLCECDCGVRLPVIAARLIRGGTLSCGCLQVERTRGARTHGKSRTRVYKIWCGMHRRCRNIRCQDYHRYGGRGIKVCARWTKFENFFADMGDPPAGTTIERKNNDGPYDPDNCVWASRKIQGANTSRAVIVHIDGVGMPLAHACALLGKSRGAVYMRRYRGASAEDALK